MPVAPRRRPTDHLENRLPFEEDGLRLQWDRLNSSVGAKLDSSVDMCLKRSLNKVTFRAGEFPCSKNVVAKGSVNKYQSKVDLSGREPVTPWRSAGLADPGVTYPKLELPERNQSSFTFGSERPQFCSTNALAYKHKPQKAGCAAGRRQMIVPSDSAIFPRLASAGSVTSNSAPNFLHFNQLNHTRLNIPAHREAPARSDPNVLATTSEHPIAGGQWGREIVAGVAVRGSVNKCASRVTLSDEAPSFPRDNYVSTHAASFTNPLQHKALGSTRQASNFKGVMTKSSWVPGMELLEYCTSTGLAHISHRNMVVPKRRHEFDMTRSQLQLGHDSCMRDALTRSLLYLGAPHIAGEASLHPSYDSHRFSASAHALKSRLPVWRPGGAVYDVGSGRSAHIIHGASRNTHCSGCAH